MPALSADGRYVTYASAATNLVEPPPSDGRRHLYLTELATGAVTCLDCAAARAAAEAGTRLGDAGRSALSATGDVVAFESLASLGAADDNGCVDIYIWRRDTGSLHRAATTPFAADLLHGAERPILSADGALLAFDSSSPELWPGAVPQGTRGAFVQDLITGVIVRISVDVSGSSLRPILSADGRFIVFQAASDSPHLGDGNDADDVYLYDGALGKTSRVSVAYGGGQADGPSYAPSLSDDGRLVAYLSAASDVGSAGSTVGAPQVFVHDQATGATAHVSASAQGAPGDGPSEALALSGDGRYVAFCSAASNLVPGDRNGHPDLFLHDRASGTTYCLSQADGGGPADGASYWPALSADGATAVWVSAATNLVTGGQVAAARMQVYVWQPW